MRRQLPLCLLFAVAAPMPLAHGAASAPSGQVTADEVVRALEDNFGVRPGQRRNHIKGVCAVGEFVADPEAARYSRSELFSGKAVPVVVRFSLAGGNPKVPDTAKNPRGMALQFDLPGDAVQHMTMINTPMFGAATPRTFLDQLIAAKPDPSTGKPDPEKLDAFRASHPDNRAQAEYLRTHNPPPSFADSAYFGIHAFKFTDEAGKVTLVRWRFVPQDSEKQLTDEQMKSMPPDFLQQELIDRTAKAPVRWDMLVKIGETGDPEDDPTVLWPEDRKEFKAGTLSIATAMPQAGAACEKVNFDPLVMADGIAPGNDPVLLFRSPAYAVSFGRRSQGK